MVRFAAQNTKTKVYGLAPVTALYALVSREFAFADAGSAIALRRSLGLASELEDRPRPRRTAISITKRTLNSIYRTFEGNF